MIAPFGLRERKRAFLARLSTPNGYRRYLGAEKDPRWREMTRRRLSAVQGALL